MLKYANTQVVFREVPDETTLAVNLTCCPHKCLCCHSKYLRNDFGDILDENEVDKLIKDNDGITCFAFMGGDNDPERVFELNDYIHNNHKNIKTCWYTGYDYNNPSFINYSYRLNKFDYVKYGPYIDHLGPLTSKTTNQVFLKRMPEGHMMNITKQFFSDED